MSALDDCLNLNQQHDYADWMRLYDTAKSELSALRAELEAARERITEWKDASVYLDESPVNDGEGDASLSLADRIAPIVNEVIALRAELAEYRTLRPAKCRTACWLGGWDAAIEAAAKACYEFECDTYEDGWEDMERGARHCVPVIRALVPPADCGDCNPLEPQNDTVSVIDAALSRGYTLHSETPLDGYGREVLEAIKRDIQQIAN